MKKLNYLFLFLILFLLQNDLFSLDDRSSYEFFKSTAFSNTEYHLCNGDQRVFTLGNEQKAIFRTELVSDSTKINYYGIDGLKKVVITNNGATGIFWAYSYTIERPRKLLLFTIHLHADEDIVVDNPYGYSNKTNLIYVQNEVVTFQVRPTIDHAMQFSYDGGTISSVIKGINYSSSTPTTDPADYSVSVKMASSISGNNVNLNFFSDLPCTDKLTIPVYVIKNPQKPTGPSSAKYGETTTYSIPNFDPKATGYVWKLEPENAGTLTSGSSSVSILWKDYFGTAKLSVAPKSSSSVGVYSSAISINVTGKPKIISNIYGAEKLCYSDDFKTFTYTCDLDATTTDIQWELTGNGASITQDKVNKNIAYVTISPNTKEFSVVVTPYIGSLAGTKTTKSVIVKSSISINFDNVSRCSGQGEIEITGIEPPGGSAWVENYRNDTSFIISKALGITNTSSGSLSNLSVLLGATSINDYDVFFKFSLPYIPSNAIIRSAILNFTIKTPFTTDDAIFGIYKNNIEANQNINGYATYKDKSYKFVDYNLSPEQTTISLDIKHLLDDLKSNNSYGIYLSKDYVSSSESVEIITSSSNYPTLSIIYYTKNTINTNSTDNYKINYEITNSGCKAFDTTTICLIRSETDADFSSSCRSFIPGSLIDFFVTNSNPNDSIYVWDFGDGILNTGNKVSHVFNDLGNFDVAMTTISKQGCEYTLNKTNFVEVTYNPSALQNHLSFDVKVYPSPFNDYLHVDLPEMSNNAFIYIYSIEGTLVYFQSITDKDNIISVSDLFPGMYFLKIEGNSISSTTKIFKTR